MKEGLFFLEPRSAPGRVQNISVATLRLGKSGNGDPFLKRLTSDIFLGTKRLPRNPFMSIELYLSLYCLLVRRRLYLSLVVAK